MKLSKVMEDSDIAQGIIVCKAGFTKDTVTYAEHVGIKLVVLREADDSDEVYVTGFLSIDDLSSTRSFTLTDQVWMIMNELFDKRRELSLSKSGLIRIRY